MHAPTIAVVHMPAWMVACALLTFAPACDSKPAPASKTDARSPLEPRGIEEMKRVRGDVEKAHEAGLQRTDDATDRAALGEAAGRDAPTPAR